MSSEFVSVHIQFGNRREVCTAETKITGFRQKKNSVRPSRKSQLTPLLQIRPVFIPKRRKTALRIRRSRRCVQGRAEMNIIPLKEVAKITQFIMKGVCQPTRWRNRLGGRRL
ncbi:hypothetical protein ASE37_22900 [Rhizobium sp. Root268]|nr:hypothetical protein ASC86_21855 [Rhizobium sp. Root1212]KRD31607.1 hypothetical protein ASE37_22900 [Rhizobium sp. Root268]